MRGGGKFFASLGSGSARIPNAVLLAIELLVLLGMLLRAWQVRSVMPLVPTADPDAWGYLFPALSWLGGFGLQQTAGRDWFYPALLALFLRTVGSFAGIVLWQKFLGICSGLLMVATWRCWASTLPVRRWIFFLVSLGGALPILAQLTNPQSLYFETAIRPEAVLSCFVYAQLACLMGYYKYRWHTAYGGRSLKPETGNRRENSASNALPSVIFGAAAIVLSYACLLLKPSWFFAFVFTSAPVFVGLFGRAPSLKARLLAPALGVACSVLLLWLPGRIFLIKDSTSRTFLPATLFTVHARLIDKALETKLAGMPDADSGKAKLRELVAVLEKELHISETLPSAWQKLGFDPDYLYYRSQLIPAIYRYVGNDDRKFAAFCFSCYKDAAFHDPLAFGGKIWMQFTHFLFPTPDTFYKDFHDFAEYYRDSGKVLEPKLPDRFPANVREMYRAYKADLVVHGGLSLMLDRTSKFRTFRHVFAPRVLAIDIIFLSAFVVSLIWQPLRDLRLSGWAAFSLFSAPLGNAITVSIVHALDINRYRHTYGGFLLFAVVAMDFYAALVIARSVRHAADAISRGAPGS